MKNIILLITIFISSFLFSQDNKGYYGTKCYVSLESVSSIALVYNVFSDAMTTKNLFNYGYRVSGSYVFKRNFALGLEVGTDISNISHVYVDENFSTPTYSSNNEYSYFENLKVSTFTFIPKIEFTNSKGLLPLGLTHQIGIGITSSDIKKGTYEITHLDNYYYDTKTTEQVTFESPFLKDPAKMLTILYALNLRTALTKKMLLSYGFRYTLNINRENFLPLSSPGQNDLNRNVIQNDILKQKSLNLISFNLGLTYAI